MVLSTNRTETEIANLQHLADIVGAQGVASWVLGDVNRQIAIASASSTTDTMTFKLGSTTLAVLTITYTDSSKVNVSSIQRTS